MTDPFFVPPRVLPDELISKIVDRLLQLDWDTLNALVDGDEIAKSHVIRIWTIASELRVTFQQQLEQKAKKKTTSKVYVTLSCQTPTQC